MFYDRHRRVPNANDLTSRNVVSKPSVRVPTHNGMPSLTPSSSRLFCVRLGMAHDWCNTTAGSWVELFRSSVVSQTTLRFWNEVSFSERSLLCNSGLLIPATNRTRRATSKCSWKLHLDANHEFAHKFITASDLCIKLRPFNHLQLGWSDVSQKCSLDFSD